MPTETITPTKAYRIIADDEVIQLGACIQWSARHDQWCDIKEGSAYIGMTPRQIHEELGSFAVFGYKEPPTPPKEGQTVLLNEQDVIRLFLKSDSQKDYIEGIYRMVHPDFDAIVMFNGHPTCNKETWTAICHHAISVDARINKTQPFTRQIMPGGCWMNSGFSCDDEKGLKLWEVIPCPENQLTR